MSADSHSPWLGLASFTEETRALFFGRSEEVAELGRRVQRKLLTILFGKSGLGKTSILRAGLVPQLRARGYIPVYLRIDYGRDSPEPAVQIKQAIARAAAAGQGTQEEVAAPDESIWEFLHHRDDVLKHPSGATLLPLLIFDQFEELFTLAQGDEFGRARAARFIEELADLVENRPPKMLEAKLEADESIAARFDFSRADYRVVIALREDYLAPLESLKTQMPSLAQNRLRLAPMTGSQALEAVTHPGKQLVSEEVAEAIVRFVAGGSELANAEVEPSLLSLICRELNEQRIAQHRAEISLDLLAGSHESILSSFYERALADQPPAVRRLIENELLTESGYRENLAEERVLRRLAATGAAPDALAVLVDRRLLRIEERLDVRRVELTHDVLTGVVKASRDQRHEREAREATEQILVEQQAQQQAAQRALRRARMIAAGCATLTVAAVAAAVLAIVNVRRAQRAEADARQTRVISEQARTQAEGLLGFLTDDFVHELESFGRYQVIADLSQREIDYFHALPAALQDPQTVRNGALALVNHANAVELLGDSRTAGSNANEAIAVLQKQEQTERSDATDIALGRAYTARGDTLAFEDTNWTDPQVGISLGRAVDLLRPIANRKGSPVEARLAYVAVMCSLATREQLLSDGKAGARDAGEATRVALELGAGRHGDVTVDGYYTRAGGYLVWALATLGRNDEARRVGREVLDVAGQVLAQHPQDLWALIGTERVEGSFAGIAGSELDPAAAARFATQADQTSLALLKIEPKNTAYIAEYREEAPQLGAYTWYAGQLRESAGYYQAGMRPYTQGVVVIQYVPYFMTLATRAQAAVGDLAGAARTVAAADVLITPDRLQKLGLTGGFIDSFIKTMRAYPPALFAYERGDFKAARQIAHTALAQWQPVPPAAGGFEIILKHEPQCILMDMEGRADYALGDFAAAADTESMALEACKFLQPTGSNQASQRNVADQTPVWLSMALVAEGRQPEAARIIGPMVTAFRALVKRNRSDQWLPLELATALYAQALTDERQRPVLLREAAKLVEHLSPGIAALHDTRAWRERIQKAQGGA